jgi:NAD(P)-dependent dehydrogenase (short-subunit alcohol dehydrogenase family)
MSTVVRSQAHPAGHPFDMSTWPAPESSVRKRYELSDRRVIVTGGAGFLGRHFAEAVAEMGARPIVLDRDAAAIERLRERFRQIDRPIDGFALDLTDPAAVRDIVSTIEQRHGTIDVLINAAALTVGSMRDGGPSYFAPVEDYDRQLWSLALETNLTGTFLITQAVAPAMKRQGKGAIVNIASDVALISPDHRIYEPDPARGYAGVPFNTTLAYSTTKAGMLAMTRYLATYWARYGIRVNALSPAGVYRNHDPQFVEQLAFRIPLGRMAFPEEYKAPLVFLASDASSFMTGANLVVDGGRTIW